MSSTPSMVTAVSVASLFVALSTTSAAAAPEDNRQAAISAMAALFKHQDPTGVDRYFASPYKQHNMHAPDELDALRALAREATKWPGVSTTAHRALADGDLVVLHSVYRNLLNLGTEVVAFDLFRFNQDGKIVEHWDALEPLPVGKIAGPSQFDGPATIEDRGRTEANRQIARQYVETVLVAGQPAQAASFIDQARFIDHARQPRLVFDATKPDLSTPMTETADARYLQVHRTVAEGNFVFVQSEGRMAGEILVINDLYRLQDGRIVEHWDVRQPVAPKARWANPNGPF